MRSNSSERIPFLEGPVGDFPFINGQPTSISEKQWLFVMAGVVAGFLALVVPLPWPGGVWSQLIPALLLPCIPLAALRHVAPSSWKAIFGKVGLREIRLMFGFAMLNIVVSMNVGVLVHALIEVAPNASTSQLGSLDSIGLFAFFAKTIPQLLGEEVITLLPFLALMQVFSYRFGWGRKGALLGAWLITALLFGLIHLPTYNWNLAQCVVIIGSARLTLTLPWILTKNIWVSTGAHIINDWTLFLMSLLGAGLVGKA